MNDMSTSNSTLPFKIRKWKEKARQAGCSIHSASPLSTISKRNGEHLFSLLETDVRSPEGNRLPHIVFVRGNATVVVPLLKNSDTGEERFLMVRQRRIGNGALNLEFPAGMLDHENDNPAEIAAKELFEETGLDVAHTTLQPLSESPLYSSSGASDEAIFYFGCAVTVSNEEFQSFENRFCGNADENEHISVTLIANKAVLKETISLQAQLGYYLFKEHFCNKNSF